MEHDLLAPFFPTWLAVVLRAGGGDRSRGVGGGGKMTVIGEFRHSVRGADGVPQGGMWP